MPIPVNDIRSNSQDQIAFAARVIGRSKRRQKVFLAIHQGKKKIKTVQEIVEVTKLSRMAVLQEAGKLCNNNIIKKTKLNGDTAYEKDKFFGQHKKKILQLAENKKQLSNFPTKTNPKIQGIMIPVHFNRKMVDVSLVTIDDIDSFSKVKGLATKIKKIPVYEKDFKEGLQKIIGEEGEFQDWGGETDDLFSTRLVINGKRKAVAFGLKGRGTSGLLTPKKMGKQGDQIQRLFRAPADVFIVQYWAQIDESVIEQMKNFAIAKSVTEIKKIYYGIIDGKDTYRLINAHPKFFP